MKPEKSRPGRLSCLMLAAGIFLLTLSPILGASLCVHMAETYGLHQTHKITASWQRSASFAGKSPLTLEEIKQLAQYHICDYDLAYAAEVSATAVYQENESQVKVLGVNDRYRQFHHLPLKTGSFLTSGHENRQVAVIDQKLAESLFGNCHAVGLEIELYGRKFSIIGIIDSDSSLSGMLTAPETGTVYLPAAKLLELDQNSGISYLEVETKTTGTTGSNTAVLEQALTAIGQDPAEFKITDYTMEFLFLEQKNLFRDFLTGIVILGLLCGLLRKKIQDVGHFLRQRLQEKYIREILKGDIGELVLHIGLVFLLVAGMLIVWQLIKFPLYIGPENIPEELIDLSFWADLLEKRIQGYFQDGKYSAFPGEAQLVLLQMIQNWNVSLSLFLGWPLFALGLKMSKESFHKTALFSCACLVTAIALGLSIQLAVQMPLAAGGKGVLLVFSAVFLSVCFKGGGASSSGLCEKGGRGFRGTGTKTDP